MIEDAPPMRLILIDRDPLALLGMRAIVKERFPAIEVCAEFESVVLAEAQAERHRPEVIVLDVEMDGGAGFALPH